MAMLGEMKPSWPANRLIGDTPTIGIRPIIDGRWGGVRESLEQQTMGMARTAAHFLEENLRHPNGLPVECVIADTCIGGVAEAARCAGKFAREGVGVSLSVTPCWCYGAETMDMDPLTPKAVWVCWLLISSAAVQEVFRAVVTGAASLTSHSQTVDGLSRS